MKRCPACQTSYADDSLRFCLDDGAELISAPEAAETVRMTFDKNPARINIPQDSLPTVFPAAGSTNPPVKKGVILLIVVALVGLLFLLVAAFAGFIFLKSFDKKGTANATPTETPKVSQTPTPTDETAALKEKLANLEKQVQSQKNQKQTVIEKSPVLPENQSEKTARVNSPGDGFLALRAAPNSETGYLIAKIPHGASVSILDCPKPSNVGKMRGHWCRVIYNGQTGWAFDGFLVY